MCSSSHGPPRPKKLPTPPPIPSINTLTQEQLSPQLAAAPALGSDPRQASVAQSGNGGLIGNFNTLRHDLFIQQPAPSKNFVGPLPMIPRFPSV